MHNYDIFEDPYNSAADVVLERENEQLVLIGIEEMLEDADERISDISREVEGLDRQLSMIRDRLEEINASLS